MNDITNLPDCGKDICTCIDDMGLKVGDRVKCDGMIYRIAPKGSAMGRLIPSE